MADNPAQDKPALGVVLGALESHWEQYGSEPTEVDVEGRAYVVHPRVFNSAGSNSAITALEGMAIPEGAKVLDMGCGYGLLGIEALHRGAGHAVFLDNSPEAIENAQANIERHGFGERAVAKVSDLFSEVQGQIFDVVLFNGPFIYFSSDELKEHVRPDSALYGKQSPGPNAFLDPGYALFQRFFAGLSTHLKPGGRLFFTFGNMGNRVLLDRFLADNGLAIEGVVSKREIPEVGASFVLLSIARKSELS